MHFRIAVVQHRPEDRPINLAVVRAFVPINPRSFRCVRHSPAPGGSNAMVPASLRIQDMVVSAVTVDATWYGPAQVVIFG